MYQRLTTALPGFERKRRKFCLHCLQAVTSTLLAQKQLRRKSGTLLLVRLPGCRRALGRQPHALLPGPFMALPSHATTGTLWHRGRPVESEGTRQREDRDCSRMPSLLHSERLRLL